MNNKKNIVRMLIGFFGLFFMIAVIFSFLSKPLMGSSLIDIVGFSQQEDVEFQTAGQERFFYEKTYTITDKEFSILNQSRDMGVLVYRVPGYYYEVEINGHTIGKVSDVNHKGSNIWNNAYAFVIDQQLIKETNTLSIKGESASAFNNNMFKVYLGRYDKISKIYTTHRVMFQYYLIISIGFIMALSIAIILIKSSSDFGQKGYVWMALGAMLFSFYLVDYIEFWSIPISKLYFRKLTILCLFTGIGMFGVGLGKRFKSQLLRRFAYVVILTGPVILMMAHTFPGFKMVYSYASIVLLILQVLILYALIQVRNDIEFGKTLAFGALVMVVTTGIDVYGMINNLETSKMSLYSIVVLMDSILTISVYHLSTDYQEIQKNAASKEEEVNFLMENMYRDSLSEYYNFKYFEECAIREDGLLTITFSRFDALDAVKNNRGIEVANKVLLATYKIFEEVFTPYGTFYVDGAGQVIGKFIDVHTEDAYNMHEKVRIKIMQSDEIKELCGYLPYTVTTGIATRIDEEAHNDLLHHANIAMLNGEGHGRNQTTIFKPKFLEEDFGEQENHHLMLNFVYTIIHTIDTRDRYTSRHSEEVSRYSVMIGEKLGLDEDHLNVLKIGSMLHDCGKLGVSDLILNKVDPLTDEETRIIRNHPIVGFQLTKQIFKDDRILNCIKYHHERFDGSGYPEGIAGKEIPLEARIVSVADAYHAMISSRKYGDILSHEMAFDELHKGTDKQFDKALVMAFNQCFD